MPNNVKLLDEIAKLHNGELVGNAIDGYYIKINTPVTDIAVNHSNLIQISKEIHPMLTITDYIIGDIWADTDTQIIDLKFFKKD